MKTTIALVTMLALMCSISAINAASKSARSLDDEEDKKPAATQPATQPTSQPATPPKKSRRRGGGPIDLQPTKTAPPDRIRRSGSAHTSAAGLPYVMGRTHNQRRWNQVELLRTTIEVTFRGEPMINAHLTYEPKTSRSRLDLVDGSASLIFDGERAWVTPADADVPMARFHLLTWSYFMSVPFKLRDPGVILDVRKEQLPHDGHECRTAHLSFEDETGDTPDDWYLLYTHPRSSRLLAMGYVFTYGRAADDASEPETHGITYDQYETFDGLEIPTKWTFCDWSKDTGFASTANGTASLTDFEFVESNDAIFKVPEGAREDALPGS